jgi:pyruvate carboxylase subunit B
VKYFLSRGNQTREAEVDGDAIRLGGADLSVEVRDLAGGGRFLVRLGDRNAVGFAARRDGAWEIQLEGRHYRILVDDERRHRIRRLAAETGQAAGPAELRAPMPGLIVRVPVEEGAEVRQGDSLIVMEAMKMENELRAEGDATVARVHVREGETVDRDELLVTFDST